MRITVNIKDSLVEQLDTAAEAHHESRAEYAGMLIESQLTGMDVVGAQYIQELEHRDGVITRQTEENKQLRSTVEELQKEMQARDSRIEQLAAVRLPAAGEADRLSAEVENLRGEVHERDIRIAGQDARLEELREKCEMLEGLMVQHFREKEMMLALLPSAREEKRGFFARLFGKQD